MTDILIKNGYVVTVDGQRQIYRTGSVAIKGQRITYVGPSDNGPQDAAQVIDAQDKLVMPGLIDGHLHPMHFLAKGTMDDEDTLTSLQKVVYPYESQMTEDDTYNGATAAFVEAIKNGTTCMNDPGGYHAHQTAQALDDVGIRGIITRSTRDVSSKHMRLPERLSDNADSAVEKCEQLLKDWHNQADGRARVWFSLRTAMSFSDELGKKIKEKADHYGVGIHSHIACEETEDSRIMDLHGLRSIPRLEKLGLLDSNAYFIHMGFLQDEDIEVLAKNDVKAIHCPTASFHGGLSDTIHEAFPRMCDAGITIALGTDAPARGRALDMVGAMFLAATVYREKRSDPFFWGAHKALEMTTIDAARACLWDDEIGSLEIGKKADIAMFAMKGPEWVPNYNPVNSLIYGSSGASAHTVVIDGKVVMQDRNILTVDEDLVCENAMTSARKVQSLVGWEPKSPWPIAV